MPALDGVNGPERRREYARGPREPVRSDAESARPAASALGAEELGAIRHDLKNVLTTLRHGCTLIAAKLAEGNRDEVQLFLDEMRTSIDKGRALVERLR